MSPTVHLSVDFGRIPGCCYLEDWMTFDGTPEGFDRALELMRAAFHSVANVRQEAADELGYEGPWSVGLDDRLLRPDHDADV